MGLFSKKQEAPPADHRWDALNAEYQNYRRRTAQELEGLQGKKLLFALSLGDTGTNLEYVRLLARLRREPRLLEGCTAGLIVDGASPLYTKSAAAELTLCANLAGCSFLGRPLVEGTGSLVNFRVQAKNLNTDLLGAYRAAARELVDRLVEGFTFLMPYYDYFSTIWADPDPRAET